MYIHNEDKIPPWLLNDIKIAFEKKFNETKTVTQRFIKIESLIKTRDISFNIPFIEIKNNEYHISLDNLKPKGYYIDNFEYTSFSVLLEGTYSVSEVFDDHHTIRYDCSLVLEFGYEINRFLFYFIFANRNESLKFKPYTIRDIGSFTKKALKSF